MKEAVLQAIEQIRPLIQEDGGDVELVNVDEKTGLVTVQLSGACCGCPLSHVTLKAGIERMLKEKVQGIHGVEAI